MRPYRWSSGGRLSTAHAFRQRAADTELPPAPGHALHGRSQILTGRNARTKNSCIHYDSMAPDASCTAFVEAICISGSPLIAYLPRESGTSGNSCAVDCVCLASRGEQRTNSPLYQSL